MTNIAFKTDSEPSRFCRAGSFFLLTLTFILLHLRVMALPEYGVTDPKNVVTFTGWTPGAGQIALVSPNEGILTFPASGSNELSAAIQNVVALGVKDDGTVFIKENFTASVTIEITYGPSSSNTQTLPSQTLTVSYSKATGTKYDSRHYIAFETAKYVKVKITNVNAPAVNGFQPSSVLFLESEMKVTRYFQLMASPTVPTISIASTQPYSDELALQWPQLAASYGKNGYQLEWAFVENELSQEYGNPGSIDIEKIFRANSTRVDLPNSAQQYSIPLYYDGAGILYYRYRAVNNSGTGRKDGPWSTTGQYSFSGAGRKMNWQQRTSFAEEGKRKTVMEYFDGSLRSRQTLTKDNETKAVIATETFYDREGRATISLLPAPVLTPTDIVRVISYQQGLNRFNQQSVSNPPSDFFDLVPVSSSTYPVMETLSGSSSMYYSSLNSQQSTGNNGYIPNAEGYPYTATRYTPDNTGRIMAQGGVGSNHQIGSSHETKYYYGSAAQEELDGLFGTEAGNKSHYFKNMVQDANGQMSVSYVDMHGRTVATSLAGAPRKAEAPGATHDAQLAINNTTDYPGQAGTLLDRNLLDLATNVIKDNSTIEAVSSLLVPITAPYTFSYSLTPQSLIGLKDCNNVNICFGCTYRLEISVTDEAGEVAPVKWTYNNISLENYACPSPVGGFSNISNTVTLNPGSYSVRKTLTIDDVSLQKAKAAFLTKTLCKTEKDIADSIYNTLTTECEAEVENPTCSSCLANLGTASGYRDDLLQQLGLTVATASQQLLSEISNTYDRAVANCNLLCPGGAVSVASKRYLMLQDMVPFSGQYAKEPPGSGTIYDTYDIFSSTGSGARPFYKNPQSPGGSLPDGYYNQYQAIETPSDLANLSAQQFSDAFKMSWAESLLPYHPEYQRLLFSENQMASSYAWADAFSKTEKYADALAAGYIIPNTAAGSNPYNDPFYNISTTDKSIISGWVTSNYLDGLSMWQLALGIVEFHDAGDMRGAALLHPKYPPYDILTTDALKDEIWRTFKGLYLAERQQHLDAYVAAQNPITNESQFVDQDYRMHFPATNKQQADQNGWSDWYPTTPGNPRGSTAPGLDPVSATNNYYQSTCDVYIAQWRKSLLQCPALASHANRDQILLDITNGMLAVCRNGTDAANPSGASTVPPTTSETVVMRSFEDVIMYYLAENEIDVDSYCNPYLIEYPKPYGTGRAPSATVITQLDECACDQFTTAIAAADNASSGLSFEEFNDFLHERYNDSITYDLFVEMNERCNSLQESFKLPTPQPLPVFLKCGFVDIKRCYSCDDMRQLLQGFNTALPGAGGPTFTTEILLTETQVKQNILFAKYVNFKTGMDYNWTDYASALAAAECTLTATNNATEQVICRDTRPLNDATGIFVQATRCDRAYERALRMASIIYENRKNQLGAGFEASYRAKCLAAGSYENFRVSYTSSEYHYTLYYYDQAGNLVKTIPPKGARPNFSSGFLTLVRSNRTAGTYYAPTHLMPTLYLYNSLNTVVAQSTPDGGASNFWYDKLGRLVASQNLKQAQTSDFSYTLYDRLGRIWEVGQKKSTQPAIRDAFKDPSVLLTWVNYNYATQQRSQITRTVYDLPMDFAGYAPANNTYVQENLRSRVSYSQVINQDNTQLAALDMPLSATDYETASFYTYDVLGNVGKLVQQYKHGAMNPGPAAHGLNEFKIIDYDYDVISGKVNKVSYQQGKEDAYMHQYGYDAENRLTWVKSGPDEYQLSMEREASYEYYQHGPLSRAVIGQQKVQGLDYTYTLHGWLRGVNSTNLNPNLDPGKDGLLSDDNNTYAARDAYGFSLHYYLNDYNHIKTALPAPHVFVGPVNGIYHNGYSPLYNGNIMAMVTDIGVLTAPVRSDRTTTSYINLYKYDQLNRLRESKGYPYTNANNTIQWNALGYFDETLTYDPNGNIMTLWRYGMLTASTHGYLDKLTYNYTTNTNRLRHVADAQPATAIPEDLETQAADNYKYDDIGNLTADASAGIGTNGITWNVYGKIATIAKTVGGVTTTIEYSYDVSGNRISKAVTSGASTITTCYVRDVQGNVMATYVKGDNSLGTSGNLTRTETPLYGSSRLGMSTTLVDVEVAAPVGPQFVINGVVSYGKIRTLTRGKKLFELSNHLGNVLAVVSDRKLQVMNTSNNSLTAYYMADVINATDYYAFGMPIPQRTYIVPGGSNYRYGFNGKENDNEVKGAGNQLDFGSRIYDSRIGRWLSVDPLQTRFPHESPYLYCGNNPILYVDPDGKRKTVTTTTITYFKDGSYIKKVDKVVTDGLKAVPHMVPCDLSTSYRKLPDHQLGYDWFDINELHTIIIKDGKEVKNTTSTNLGAKRTWTNFNIEWYAETKANASPGGGGGITFYSSDGQHQETRVAEFPDKQRENIGPLLDAIDMAKSAGDVESVLKQINEINNAKSLKEFAVALAEFNKQLEILEKVSGAEKDPRFNATGNTTQQANSTSSTSKPPPYDKVTYIRSNNSDRLNHGYRSTFDPKKPDTNYVTQFVDTTKK